MRINVFSFFIVSSFIFFAQPAVAQLAGTDLKAGDSCTAAQTGHVARNASATQDAGDITLICDGDEWVSAAAEGTVQDYTDPQYSGNALIGLKGNQTTSITAIHFCLSEGYQSGLPLTMATAASGTRAVHDGTGWTTTTNTDVLKTVRCYNAGSGGGGGSSAWADLTGVPAGFADGTDDVGSVVWQDGATAGEVFYNGGNVGIGTTDPATKLQITNGSGYGSIMLGDNTSGKNYHITTPDDKLDFYTGSYGSGTSTMTLDQANNVGIGTRDPQSKLHVNGTIRATEICDENGANCNDVSAGLGGGGGAPTCKADMSNINIGDTCDDGSKFLGSYPNFGWQGFYVTNANQSTSSNWSNAKTICNNLNRHGHTDWFLPTISQLRYNLYPYRGSIGGFSAASYWSSTSVNGNQAYTVSFASGSSNQDEINQTSSRYVRCVRRG